MPNNLINWIFTSIRLYALKIMIAPPLRILDIDVNIAKVSIWALPKHVHVPWGKGLQHVCLSSTLVKNIFENQHTLSLSSGAPCLQLQGL